MGRSKRDKEGGAPAASPPVLNLTIDSKTPEAPREVAPAAVGAIETPCSITGLGAGLSGGALGWVFGFGGYWIRSIRGGGQWKASLGEGWASAKTFGVMGGLYAAVNCFMVRLRQKNDAWNGAASGCATGLALGWKQGPLGALQSCATLGAFSFFIDRLQPGEAHAAAAAGVSEADAGGAGGAGGAGDDASSSGSVQQRRRRQQQWQRQRDAVELLLSPAMPLLAAVAPCAFATAGAAAGDEPGSGCRVVRRR